MEVKELKNDYPSFKKLYELYSMPYNKIMYEGKQYKFVRTIRNKGIHIDVYRNDNEQHTLEIYLIGQKVCYINTYYRITLLRSIS